MMVHASAHRATRTQAVFGLFEHISSKNMHPIRCASCLLLLCRFQITWSTIVTSQHNVSTCLPGRHQVAMGFLTSPSQHIRWLRLLQLEHRNAPLEERILQHFTRVPCVSVLKCICIYKLIDNPNRKAYVLGSGDSTQKITDPQVVSSGAYLYLYIPPGVDGNRSGDSLRCLHRGNISIS